MMERGRVVVKIAGREAGKFAVIVENKEDGFMLITGPKAITGVKRRKCNIEHIEPTENKLELDSDEDAKIEENWKDSGLIEKLGIEVPVKREFKKKEVSEKKASEKPKKEDKVAEKSKKVVKEKK
jgi:large subunit ribosomal protein L14e